MLAGKTLKICCAKNEENGIYSAFDIFQEVVFRLALHTEEMNFANFCHDLM